jgi:hypothetical protein
LRHPREENQVGRPICPPALAEPRVPGLLHVQQDEVHELDQVRIGIGLWRDRFTGRSRRGLGQVDPWEVESRTPAAQALDEQECDQAEEAEGEAHSSHGQSEPTTSSPCPSLIAEVRTPGTPTPSHVVKGFP